MGVDMQRTAETIGKYGCYFLSLVRAGELLTGIKRDALRLFQRAVEKGWSETDCFLLRPDLILQDITGDSWTVRKEGADYIPRQGEIVILRYEYKTTAGLLAHFVLAEADGETIGYDPYEPSQTVARGYLVSKRVFKCMK